MTLARAHRLTAAMLGLFLVLHMGNHLALLAGIEAHRSLQSLLRPLYRPAPVEATLLALFALQIVLGLALARRRGLGQIRGRGWALAQVASGLYLAFFLIQHVPAVLLARAATPPVDTNARFAASVLSGWQGFYFAPYYAIALTALATHLAAAAHFRSRTLHWLPWAGLGLGLLVVTGLTGALG